MEWKVTRPYLWATLAQHKFACGFVVVTGFIVGVFTTAKSLIESALINAVADVVREPNPSHPWPESVPVPVSDDADWVSTASHFLFGERPIAEVIGGYLAIVVLGAVLSVAAASARQQLTRTMFTLLHADGLAKGMTVARLDLQSSEDEEPGGLSGSVQQGSDAVSGAYSFLIEVIQYAVAIITAVAVLVKVDIAFGVCCLLVALALAVLSWLQARRLHTRRHDYDARRRSLIGFASDVLANREMLIANEQAPKYLNRLRTAAYDMASIDKSISIRERAFDRSALVVQDLGLILILTTVLVFVWRGVDFTQVGEAYFFTSVFYRLVSPIGSLLNGYDAVARSLSTSGTLITLLKSSNQPLRSVPAAGSGSFETDLDLSLRNVNFSYGEKPVLRDCTLTIPGRKVTLIVGRSGSGKTTIAKLLLRFLEPDSGYVYVGGRDVAVWDHAQLLSKMSYLAQTGHVVRGTVEENVFATDETGAVEALQKAGLTRSHAEAKEILTARAHQLSEGQKQRLAVARILADDSDIALLDEPLAGVDAFTFRDVRDQISAWMTSRTRTVVIISHRLAFASIADHVIVLGEDGDVLEQGDPTVLERKPGGTFASLREASMA